MHTDKPQLDQVTRAQITRAKRAVVVMNEILRESMRGKPLPPELTQDLHALMTLIRTAEKSAR